MRHRRGGGGGERGERDTQGPYKFFFFFFLKWGFLRTSILLDPICVFIRGQLEIISKKTVVVSPFLIFTFFSPLLLLSFPSFQFVLSPHSFVFQIHACTLEAAARVRARRRLKTFEGGLFQLGLTKLIFQGYAISAERVFDFLFFFLNPFFFGPSSICLCPLRGFKTAQNFPPSLIRLPNVSKGSTRHK